MDSIIIILCVLLGVHCYFLYFFKSDRVSGDYQRGGVSSHGAGSSG